ncbi:MAG: hypothetical protein Kow00128_21340 [Deltaproteobacteria bacterium]
MGAGRAWKEKREGMGRTLEEISQELRISRKYLQGIEEGQYAKWPPKVFSAGFIRAYARLLDENPEPVLSEYYAFIGALPREERPLPGTPQWIEREHRRGSRRTVYSLAAAGVLLAGILVAWYSVRTAPTPPPEVRIPPPAASAASPQASPAPDNAASVPPPAAAKIPAPAPAAKGGPLLSAGSAAGPPYQLLLEASELSWVMYSTDDAGPVDVMLYPGERISLQAQKTITLKLGNAGGVRGTLNGETLPSFGEQGQVREVRLGE